MKKTIKLVDFPSGYFNFTHLEQEYEDIMDWWYNDREFDFDDTIQDIPVKYTNMNHRNTLEYWWDNYGWEKYEPEDYGSETFFDYFDSMLRWWEDDYGYWTMILPHMPKRRKPPKCASMLKYFDENFPKYHIPRYL